MHKITVEKPKDKLRVIIETPSGKKEIRWVGSRYSVEQICEEYGVSVSSVRWSNMK